MTQHYSNPERANDPHALPDIETFYVSPHTRANRDHCTCKVEETDTVRVTVETHNAEHVGWYWWPCFPGCLPDGDPCGPFATEAEAHTDARNLHQTSK